MKKLKFETEFDPAGSRTFVRVTLLAIFGVPFAIHVVASILQ